jgi:hypothetical protein
MPAAETPSSRGPGASGVTAAAAAAGRADTGPEKRSCPAGWRGRPGAGLVGAAAFAAAAVVLFVCYLRLSRTQPVVSDGASNALQAWDMLHGNWLLRGWTTSDVSFYTTELPEYVAVEAVRGLTPDVVHVAAAVTYTLMVLLAGLLAKGRSTGREAVVRVLIASGIMLAPQLGNPAFVLLLSPDHVGTAVPLMAIWLVMDRAQPAAGRPRHWYLPVVIGLMLAWVIIADRMAVTAAVIPLVLVCGIRACRGLVRHREPLATRWLELSLGAAAICSVGIASAALRLIRLLGGFTVLPVNAAFATPDSMPAHLRLTAEGVLGLYGADFFGMPLGSAAVIALVHLAGVALAAWAVCRGVRRFFRCDDLLVQVLAVAVLVSLAVYLFSIYPVTFYNTREIGVVLPFGAVLAGRLLTGSLIRARLLPALSAVLLCYGVALAHGAAQPAQPAHDQDLANWLTFHHLTVGLAEYAQANNTTLDSRGQVMLLAPSWHRPQPAARADEDKVSWFSPRQHDANFIVSTMADGPRSAIPSAEVAAAFGRPQRTYHFRGFTIMVWDKNLLRDLHWPAVTSP